MTRPISLALTCALLTLACGEKKAPASSGDAAEEAPSEQTAANDLPGDKASQAFGDALADLEIARFAPTDDGVLIYDSLSFERSGTWTAAAAVEVMDERMECTESGSWTMDPAESAPVRMPPAGADHRFAADSTDGTTAHQ